jgi:hypothetical protein
MGETTTLAGKRQLNTTTPDPTTGVTDPKRAFHSCMNGRFYFQLCWMCIPTASAVSPSPQKLPSLSPTKTPTPTDQID